MHNDWIAAAEVLNRLLADSAARNFIPRKLFALSPMDLRGQNCGVKFSPKELRTLRITMSQKILDKIASFVRNIAVQYRIM